MEASSRLGIAHGHYPRRTGEVRRRRGAPIVRDHAQTIRQVIEREIMPESTQEKLKRVRTPRVHITYEVETDGARIIKELPFVMGVIGNFSGSHPTQELRPLEERKFVEINRDNFDNVMKRMGPGLETRVENTIEGNGTTFSVQLAFNSLSDFEPANIIQQVEPLKKLLETRNHLRDLISKVDRSAELEGILEQVLKNTEDLEKLSTELGVKAAAGTPSDGEGPADDRPKS
jgi:type VI secretion system protein ImpB